MQRLPKRLVDGAQLTATAAVYYTAPANSLTTISAASVTNTTATPQTVTVYLVPALGSVEVNGVKVNTRDGAAIADVETVKITALEDAEIVLVDAV